MMENIEPQGETSPDADIVELKLTSSELRIIRNYRAMEIVGQQAIEDISEELAIVLAASCRRGSRAAASGR